VQGVGQDDDADAQGGEQPTAGAEPQAGEDDRHVVGAEEQVVDGARPEVDPVVQDGGQNDQSHDEGDPPAVRAVHLSPREATRHDHTWE